MSQIWGKAVSGLARLSRSGPSPAQWLNAAAHGIRRYSAAAVSGAPLPLEGYRVLDMTRVLAGVSWRLTRVCTACIYLCAYK